MSATARPRLLSDELGTQLLRSLCPHAWAGQAEAVLPSPDLARSARVTTADASPAPSGSPVPRREVWPIVVLAVVAAVLFAVAHLGSEIGEGETRGFDTRILLALRDAGDTARPVGPAWLQAAMLDLTALGGTAVLTLVTAAALGYLLVAGRYATALVVAIAVGGGSLLNGLLKSGCDRARPDLVAHLVQVQSASFPSGHAMNSAVVYLTLGALLARAMPAWRVRAYVVAVGVALTLLVGASRVFLGVHWPTDVIGGWAVGASWACLCWLAARALQRRRVVETPAGGVARTVAD